MYPPALILFCPLNQENVPSFEGVGSGLLPNVLSEVTFPVKYKKEKQYTVYRCQLALTAAYSFTHHKGQGQTLDYIIVDLADPPKHNLDAFHMYVTLSQSCGRQLIRVLQKFNLNCLITPPLLEVTAEDGRLAHLHASMKEQYQQGEFNF
ncbi:hypothetical protein ARMSODRAFT_883566 [Armillaria solidipes]|uniref:Uncharacterized protein n=1 Tax=Armillaria solidipes TaxID=1076256 RepID=A0A2H3BR38_9AGAR|nr:hypothetical protein ARMSODRAFT_883566 [Armillaria solidipes]